MVQPAEPLDIPRLKNAIAAVMTAQRRGGNGNAVLWCHRTLRALDHLDRSLKGESVPPDDDVQRGSLWDWFKGLFGVEPDCGPSDVTGAVVTPNGDILEPNGNLIHCANGVECDDVNRLWICA